MSLISIVVPTHNELPNIERLYRRIAEVFDHLPAYDFELIFSDDSSDDTAREIARLHEFDRRIKLIRLSRRFGQAIAIAAGIDRCSGQALVLMDADLQDPPEAIPEMLKLWEAGNEIVYAQRESSSHYALYKFFSRVYYRLLKRLASVEIPLGAGEFRLLDHKVIQFLKRVTEQTRFLRGLSVWPGFRQASIRIERPSRQRGQTNYNFGRSLLVAVDGIVSFSILPLRLATFVGAVVAGLSLIAGIAYAALKLFTSISFGTGWTSIIVSIFFIGGVQLMVLGILGEYVGRIFLEVQNRPVYWVDFELGFTARDESARPQAARAAR